MFKWFKKRRNKVTKVQDTGNNVFLDYGNNTIKAISDGEPLIIKSCIREVANNFISKQINAVNIDGRNFIIGESTIEYNSSNKKINREFTKELILFVVNSLNQKFKPSKDGVIDVNLHMLLPYNELNTEEEFISLLSGLNSVNTIGGEKFSYRINLKRCYAEGDMALNFLNLDNGRDNQIILDIGGGTTEWFVYDKYNNLINKLSTREGTRNLMARYIEVLDEHKNSNAINNAFAENYPFTTKDWENITKTNMEFIRYSMSDGRNLILDYMNPYSTNITCIGGGSKALEGALKKYFSKEKFQLKFLNDKESVLANLYGLRNFVLEGNKINQNNKISMVEERTEVEKVVNPVKEKPLKTKIKATNEDVENRRNSIKELSRLGISIKEIAKQLDVSEQTVKNDRRYLSSKGEL